MDITFFLVQFVDFILFYLNSEIAISLKLKT